MTAVFDRCSSTCFCEGIYPMTVLGLFLGARFQALLPIYPMGKYWKRPAIFEFLTLSLESFAFF